MTPSLGSIDLLERLTELGKTVHLLFTGLLQTGVRRGVAEHPEGGAVWGVVCRNRCRASARSRASLLPAPPCVHQPRSSPNPVRAFEISGGFIMWA